MLRRFSSFGWIAAVLVACALGHSTVAAAQDPATQAEPARMYRGLFEGTRPIEGTGQKLVMELKVYEGHQDEGPTDGSAATLQRSLPLNDSFEGITGGPIYARRGDSLSFGGQGLFTVRHYHETGDTVPINELAYGWLDASPTSSTVIRLHQFVRYSPYYLHSGLGNFSGGELNDLSTELNEPIGDRPTTTLASNAEIVQHLGRKWDLSGYFTYRTTFVENNEDLDLTQHQAHVRLHRAITNHLGAHFGYGYHTVRYQSGLNVLDSQDLDIGLDYTRTLSLTRKTYFNFMTGSTAMRRVGKDSFHIIGDVGLTREIGRSWIANVAYRKRLTATEIVAQPLDIDFISATVSGYASRRLDVSGIIRYTLRGQNAALNPVVEPTSSDYNEALGNAQVRYAFTRHLGLYGQYLFYDYRVGSSLTVVGNTATTWRSNGFRIGLTWWAPIIGRQ
jgi:hypothetical protein